MEKIVRLCYRKIIDSTSPGAWEKLVWADSYTEYKMQHQFYDPKGQYRTFARLLHHVPTAEGLHFRVSGAIAGYMTQLKNKIPDITNVLGLTFLPFNDYRFEIINSDVIVEQSHAVAINFYSDELRWIDTLADTMVLSLSDTENAMMTELVKLRPFLSIYSIQKNTP